MNLVIKDVFPTEMKKKKRFTQLTHYIGFSGNSFTENCNYIQWEISVMGSTNNNEEIITPKFVEMPFSNNREQSLKLRAREYLFS